MAADSRGHALADAHSVSGVGRGISRNTLRHSGWLRPLPPLCAGPADCKS